MAVQGKQPDVPLATGAEKGLVLLLTCVLLEVAGGLEGDVAVLGGAGVCVMYCYGGMCTWHDVLTTTALLSM